MGHSRSFMAIIVLAGACVAPLFSEEATPPKDFCFDVRRDIGNFFGRTKGAYLYRTKGGIDVYECKVSIGDVMVGNALTADVTHDNESGIWACTYVFYRGQSRSEAQTVYYNLTANVDYCRFPSGWKKSYRSNPETGLIEELVYSKRNDSDFYIVAMAFKERTSGYMVYLEFQR